MAEKMSSGPSTQVVEGLRFPALFLEDNIRSAFSYKPRPDDLFLCTYPKCGSTWTGQILLLILRKGQPLKSFTEMYNSGRFLEMAGAQSAVEMQRPGPIKTHLPFHLKPSSKEAKYIYVTRNPKDCCVSYFHHMKNVPGHDFTGTFDEFFELFISGEIDYGDYFDNLLGWYSHRNDPNVLFLTYEEMKEDIDSAILKMASFIDDEKYAEPIRKDPEVLKNIKTFSSFKEMKDFMSVGFDDMLNMTPDRMAESDLPDTMKAFIAHMLSSMQNSESQKMNAPNIKQFIRKGIVGDWRNYFSEDQNRRLEEKFAYRTQSTDIPDLFQKYM